MPSEISLPALFQLGYYWETKILLTSVKLDIYTYLWGGSRTADEVATTLGTDRRAILLLLNALTAIGILRKVAPLETGAPSKGDRFENSAVANEVLVRGRPGYAGHLLLLQEDEWEHWGNLEEVIRKGSSPVRGSLFSSRPEMAENVLMVLHRMGLQSAPGLARVIDLRSCRTLLDVGGGTGVYSIHFCRMNPQLKATVFDLPETLKVAERFVREAGMEERIELRAGNFHRDSLGGPYDAAFVSDILHYQDSQENAKLFARIFEALDRGGQIIVKDRFINPDGVTPAWTSAFAVHLLVYTEKGRVYTLSDAREWLAAAGFDSIAEREAGALLHAMKKEKT